MIDYENLLYANKHLEKEYYKSFKVLINSGYYILGKNVRKFEEKFCKINKSKYAIGVSNGLDGLILSLEALKIIKKNKNEVIVPANTYFASILSIVRAGLKPILVEPEIDSYNIDPQKIVSKINKNTLAIMVVHLYGLPCDMNPIINIAKKNKVDILEDCSQSHGSKYNNIYTGNFGIASSFSCFPTKNLGALGDAGIVTVRNNKVNQIIRDLRNYGSNKKYLFKYFGFNNRLDETQALFLINKLKKLNSINSHKRKLANIYNNELNTNFIKPATYNNRLNVFHIYPIRIDKRNKLKKYLIENGIKTEIHYPVPPHKQKAMVGKFGNQNFPITEDIHKTILSLPISYFHSEKNIINICKVLNKF
jgi:dTDP-4-amino-4,6-dideoxygalactose transaminase